MAVDLSGLMAPYDVGVATLNATPGLATAVTVPRWARTVTLRVLTSGGAADTGSIEREGTDGVAIGANAFPLLSGETLAFRVSGGKGRPSAAPVLYLAGGTASAVAHILVEAG